MNVDQVVTSTIKQLQEKGYTEITEHHEEASMYRVLFVQVPPVGQWCLTIHTVEKKFCPDRIQKFVDRLPHID
jgi:hypothetical protein